MFPAASRLAVVAALSPLLLAAGPAPHVAPTRPGSALAGAVPVDSGKFAALPVSRFGGLDFVAAHDVAALLGWKTEWVESARRFTLLGPATRVELTAGSREVAFDDLRLFLGYPTLLRSRTLYLSKTDFQRGLMPLLRPALLGPLLGRPKVIVLDPGHGGADQGMENKALGLKEKVLTLDVAERLKHLLEARGYTVVLTRTDDRQLGPDKQTDFLARADITNRAGADLFVSIHFNSLYPDTKTSGTEVYTFTRAGQRSDRAWGFGEKDDAEARPAPVNRFDPWSSLLAHALHRAVISRLKTFDRGQKTMHAAVLRGLNCPAVLVESVFLSNDAEARRAATPAYRQQIAEALAAGIGDYADALGAIAAKPAAPPAVTTSPHQP